MADTGILVLRVALGIVMILHGVDKFQRTSVLEKKWREDWGFPRGAVLLTGFLQVAGGLAMVAGVFSRVAALILLLVMVVATYVSIRKVGEPFLSTARGKGWDINFLLMGSLFALILLGDGKWSLAGWWFR